MQNDSTIAPQYPGVDLAYGFVLPSYSWMLTRLEAADNRLQGILVLTSTVTFGVPTIVKAMNASVSFESGRFRLALVAFAILTTIGIVARTRGAIRLANPAFLYDQWLHYSTWEFKKNAVYWAGDHFQLNAALVRRKFIAAGWMMGFFLIELLFMFAWIVTS